MQLSPARSGPQRSPTTGASSSTTTAGGRTYKPSRGDRINGFWWGQPLVGLKRHQVRQGNTAQQAGAEAPGRRRARRRASPSTPWPVRWKIFSSRRPKRNPLETIGEMVGSRRRWRPGRSRDGSGDDTLPPGEFRAGLAGRRRSGGRRPPRGRWAASRFDPFPPASVSPRWQRKRRHARGCIPELIPTPCKGLRVDTDGKAGRRTVLSNIRRSSVEHRARRLPVITGRKQRWV